MSDREELARINEKLDGLKETVDEMKTLLWARVEAHSKEIPVIASQVKDLRQLSWYLVSTVMGLFIAAVWAVIAMRHG